MTVAEFPAPPTTDTISTEFSSCTCRSTVHVFDLSAAETDERVNRLDTGNATEHTARYGRIEFGDSPESPFRALGPASVIGTIFVVRYFDIGFTDEADDVT